MSDKLIWNNIKAYDPKVVIDRILFVKKNMNGLLPLYGKEKKALAEYATKHNLPPYELYSLRNILKIQKEITASKYFMTSIDKIKIEYLSNNDFAYFLKRTKMPLVHLIRLIENMPNVPETDKKLLSKIKLDIKKFDLDTRNRAIEFEKMLETYLESVNIPFQTESDIRLDNIYTVTPDILFAKPIVLQVDGVDYTIRWIDAKNYMLVDVPFIIKSLHKQATKYNSVFGPGAFVFHYGFDSSIKVPHAIILDGSMIG